MSGSHYVVRIPKRAVRWTAGGLAALLLSAWILRVPLLTAVGGFLELRSPCARADVIVVLAGDPGERVAHAVALYRKGVAPVLLLSGGPIGDTTWAELMRRQAMSLGVPESALRVQGRSTSTTEDARFSAEILSSLGARRVCVVTSSYHSRRAVRAFRKALSAEVELSSDPVTPSWWKERPWWRSDLGRNIVFSEYVKTVWGWFGAEY